MVLAPYFFFIFLVATVGLVMALLERKRAIARIVVGQMALVTSQNIPLAMGLMLAGRGEQGAAGLILRHIADLLMKGLPLDEAIAIGYRSCPGLVRSVIHAGQRSGRLAATLKTLEDDLSNRAERRAGWIPIGLSYGVALFVFELMIWIGVFVAVVPKFKEIFKDFGCRLPGITIAMISASQFFVDSGLMALVIVLLAFGLPSVVYWSFRPRRPARPRLVSRIADRVRWIAPGFGRMEAASGLATTASLMRLFTGAGMSLEQAAMLSADTDVNIVLRRRIRRFASLLSQGTPPPAAARRAGLGDVVATALRLGERGDQLDPALRFVADYYRGTISRLWIVMRSMSWPVITCVMAVLIGIVVVALFLPLVTLINGVSGSM